MFGTDLELIFDCSETCAQKKRSLWFKCQLCWKWVNMAEQKKLWCCPLLFPIWLSAQYFLQGSLLLAFVLFSVFYEQVIIKEPTGRLQPRRVSVLFHSFFPLFLYTLHHLFPFPTLLITLATPSPLLPSIHVLSFCCSLHLSSNSPPYFSPSLHFSTWLLRPHKSFFFQRCCLFIFHCKQRYGQSDGWRMDDWMWWMGG